MVSVLEKPTEVRIFLKGKNDPKCVGLNLFIKSGREARAKKFLVIQGFAWKAGRQN